MKKLLSAALLFVGIQLVAQPAFEWASGAYGTSNFDYGTSITSDNQGASFLTGQFEGTVDFDPGAGLLNITSSGGQDVFVMKHDNAGSLVWVKSIGSAGNDRGRAIAIDNSGNIYVAGTFSGTVDFDPGAGIFTMTAASTDAFILKLDPDGNFQWAKQFAGTITTIPHALKLDPAGNIYVAGAFSSTVDFDPGAGTFNLTSLGGIDAFCTKLSSSGDLVWAIRSGGTGSDGGIGLSIDATGNVVLSGTFENTVDFDPGAGVTNISSQGSSDLFIQKLNSSGGLVWVKSVGGTGIETSGNNIINSDGSLLFTGSFQNSVDFDPNAGVFSASTISFLAGYILSLDGNGNFNWMKQIEGATPGGSIGCYSIVRDDFDSLYVAGGFDGTFDFDPGAGTFLLSQTTGTAGFIQKLDNNGDFIWAGKLADSTPSTTEVLSISVDSIGRINATGSFQGVTDFDPGSSTFNLTSAGGYDIFNLRLNQCEFTINADVASLPDVVSECSVNSLTPPTASNCEGTFTGVPDVMLPVTSPGLTVVTWSYTNSLGFTASQTQNIVIDDVTAPVADVTTLTDVTSECEVTGLTAPTATDNCSGIITGTHNATLPVTTSTTITWTYDDGNGNTSTQTQDVVITPIDNGVTQIDALTLSADASGYTYQWVDCDNANAPISGATSQTFVATDNGNYAVVIDNGACSVTSACMIINSVGFEELFENRIDLYPNPLNDWLIINSTDTVESVRIYSGDGKLVIAAGSVSKVDLTGLESGMYFIEVKTTECLFTKQIIKQ